MNIKVSNEYFDDVYLWVRRTPGGYGIFEHPGDSTPLDKYDTLEEAVGEAAWLVQDDPRVTDEMMQEVA